jgi:single-stranded-DNA-specific exonuclease
MYNRPSVVITIEEGLGKGSARSIPGLNLYESLARCSEYLESFGGHAMAAGLTIREERIPEFQNTFEKMIQRKSQGKDLVPKIWIDTELDFAQISGALIDELESLMPFGAGNPEPLFMARDIEVVTSKKVGKYHRRMVLRQSTGNPRQTFTAIHFNVDERTFQKDRFDQIVFKLQWNRWNERKTAQIVIEDQR